MEHQPVLIYNVHSDAQYTYQDFQPVEPFPGSDLRHYFERSITVENISDDNDDEVYQKLKVSDESITKVKFIPGTREYRKRVVITYRTADACKAAALEYDQTPEYPNTCAMVVADFLNKIKETEVRISSESTVKEQDQIIVFKTDQAQDSAELFRHRLTELFSSVSSQFAIFIQRLAPHGTAMVQVSTLSEALGAEMAIWGKELHWGKFEARIHRHPVYIKHDLDVRLSLIGHPEERRIILNKGKIPEEKAASIVRFTAFNPLICENCITKAKAKFGEKSD